MEPPTVVRSISLSPGSAAAAARVFTHGAENPDGSLTTEDVAAPHVPCRQQHAHTDNADASGGFHRLHLQWISLGSEVFAQHRMLLQQKDTEIAQLRSELEELRALSTHEKKEHQEQLRRFATALEAQSRLWARSIAAFQSRRSRLVEIVAALQAADETHPVSEAVRSRILQQLSDFDKTIPDEGPVDVQPRADLAGGSASSFSSSSSSSFSSTPSASSAVLPSPLKRRRLPPDLHVSQDVSGRDRLSLSEVQMPSAGKPAASLVLPTGLPEEQLMAREPEPELSPLLLKPRRRRQTATVSAESASRDIGPVAPAAVTVVLDDGADCPAAIVAPPFKPSDPFLRILATSQFRGSSSGAAAGKASALDPFLCSRIPSRRRSVPPPHMPAADAAPPFAPRHQEPPEAPGSGVPSRSLSPTSDATCMQETAGDAATVSDADSVAVAPPSDPIVSDAGPGEPALIPSIAEHDSVDRLFIDPRRFYFAGRTDRNVAKASLLHNAFADELRRHGPAAAADQRVQTPMRTRRQRELAMAGQCPDCAAWYAQLEKNEPDLDLTDVLAGCSRHRRSIL